MKKYKVIVAGGRNFEDYTLLKEKLDLLLQEKVKNGFNIELVSGKAKGADSLGERYANEKGYSVAEFPADWKNINHPKAVIKENRFGKYNAMAGHIRNKEMAEYADALVAFWDGKSSGTKNMIDNAKRLGLQVKVVMYSL